MKAASIISIAVTATALTMGCSTLKEASSKNTTKSVAKPHPWTNKHLGSPDLAGVCVQQYPDNPYEAPAWEGKHPAMILFVMWDGRVNQVEYKPSGEVRSDWWWNINHEKHDYSYIWEGVDYSHGSDPKFEHHPKPFKS